jgi:hypothetical protein
LLPSDCSESDYGGIGRVSEILSPVRTATYTISTLGAIVLLVLGIRAAVTRAMGDGGGE